MMATMQCKIPTEGIECPRTFEIRLKCPAAQQPALLAGLQRFGRNRIIDDGLLNAATVTGFGDTLYFVVTDGRGQRGDNANRTWRNEMKKVTCSDLRKLPEVAQIESVRPFTRFSQRRFGWGDAQSTRKDVVAAAREENSAELLAIMPEARSFLRARAFASSFRRSAFGVAGCPCRLQAPVLHRKYEHTKGAWSLWGMRQSGVRRI